MLTFNGNENILQNDMGNAQVMDAKTGNMIGLNDGFVPVGIKEHGGVLYIASYNPKTEKGELGTIPSPRIAYTLKDAEYKTVDVQLSDTDNNINTIVDSKVNLHYIPLDEGTIFRVGDQFLVQLDIEGLIKANDTDLISTFDNPKLYKITLYSKTVQGEYININDIIKDKQPYINTEGKLVESDYWFLLNTDNIDLDKTYKQNKLLMTYPNIPAGYLHVKIEVEKPKNIKVLLNSSTECNSPIYNLRTL